MKNVLVVSWEDDCLVLRRTLLGGRRVNLPPLKTIPIKRPTRISHFNEPELLTGLQDCLGRLLTDSEKGEGIWFLLPTEWVHRICLDKPKTKSPSLTEGHLRWELKQRLPDSEDWYRALLYPNSTLGAIDVVTVNSLIVQTIHNVCLKTRIILNGVSVEPAVDDPYPINPTDDLRQGSSIHAAADFSYSPAGLTFLQIAKGVGVAVGVMALIVLLIFVGKSLLPEKSPIKVTHRYVVNTTEQTDSIARIDNLTASLATAGTVTPVDTTTKLPEIAPIVPQVASIDTADGQPTITPQETPAPVIAEEIPSTPVFTDEDMQDETPAPAEKKGFIAWLTGLFSRKPAVTETTPAPAESIPIAPEPVEITPISNRSPISRLLDVLPEGSKLELGVLSRADLKFEISGAVTPEQIITALSSDPTFPQLKNMASYPIGKNQGFFLRAEQSNLFSDNGLVANFSIWTTTAQAVGMTITGHTAKGTLEQAINLLDELWLTPNGVQKIYLRPEGNLWTVTVQ